PIWITGNLTMGNSDTIKLDDSFGATSGIVVVDNFINFGNTDQLKGTPTAGSYLFLLSNFNSRDDPTHRHAIDISNGGNSGQVYSNLGSILMGNGNTLSEITGWKLILSNGATITYSTGLGSQFFSSGPAGSYSVIKG